MIEMNMLIKNAYIEKMEIPKVFNKITQREYFYALILTEEKFFEFVHNGFPAKAKKMKDGSYKYYIRVTPMHPVGMASSDAIENVEYKFIYRRDVDVEFDIFTVKRNGRKMHRLYFNPFNVKEDNRNE